MSSERSIANGAATPAPAAAGGRPALSLATVPYNETSCADFSRLRPYTFDVVADCDALNRKIAREAVDLVKAANETGKPILFILPVGPLDYRYWADLCNAENVSCRGLTTMCMDDYLNDAGDLVSTAHPLSFRAYIQRTLLQPLQPALRPPAAKVKFPDPRNPTETTALIESFGGADVCYGGMGITGHLAFNDPPEPGATASDDEVRNSRTRCLTITRESATQMAMGGVNGNWDILPRRAVTLGMYELLMSKKIHLTFMRSWHAGVLRRALFGPITGRCPGSFVQTHENLEVTMTELAARPPLCNVAQAIGDQEQI